MKRLSDYQGEAAIELWAELLDPISAVLQDEEVRKALSEKGASAMKRVQAILKTHKAEASKVLLTIDPTPLNGLNIIARLLDLVLEVENSEEFAGFFGSARQQREEEFSGSVMANTEAI